MPASLTARKTTKRGRKAKGGAKRGKKKLATTEAIIAAVESVTNIAHEVMSCPLVEGEVYMAKCILWFALRYYGGWTQARIVATYGTWPNSVTRAQKKIRLMVQNRNRKSYNEDMAEKMDLIKWNCRMMYQVEKGEREARTTGR